MEEFADEDVGVLSDVFVVIWSVVVGGICDYHECIGWIWIVAWYRGADFPAVFRLEDDANERNGIGRHRYEVAWFDGKAIGGKSGMGGFTSTVDTTKEVGNWPYAFG